MDLRLPDCRSVRDDAGRVMVAYNEATMRSTHSMAKEAGYGAMGDVAFALPKVWDPARRGMAGNYGAGYNDGLDVMQFDTNDEVREQILLACRNIAKTHPVVFACINILSRYPVRGIRLEHKDKDLERFYRELFLEDLGFRDFLIDVGRSFWCDGSAFVYGTWSDSLGLWVGEDLLDPVGMRVEHIPFTGADVISMVPTEGMRDAIMSNGVEALKFRQQYPEMYEAVRMGRDIPISQDRLCIVANKERPSDTYGTPMLLRAWNTLRLEDRMQSAMQATADRLYSPLIMFTVGGTLPNGQQYIPSANALDAFRSNLDAALASNFRAIVTHSGVQSQEVVRQTNMSAFKNDLDMYDERIFMAFGLGSSILKPSSQNYATSALEFQLVSQIMSTYQDMLIGVYRKQAAFVAEAHEHYALDDDGEVIYERREVWDEDEQDFVVKQVPKLDFPELKFDVINFKDEQEERKFRMELRKEGIPISDKDIAIGVDVDLEESEKRFQEEQIHKYMMQSQRNSAIYKSAKAQDLPVPPDVAKFFADSMSPSWAARSTDEYREDVGAGFGGNEGPVPQQGESAPESSSPSSRSMSDDLPGDGVRPEVSDEQREDMPKAGDRR